MPILVIEHLKASELPQHWIDRLKATPDQTVTVLIETEPESASPERTVTFVTDDPAFGIWRDRDDMADVPGYLRGIRAPRFRTE